MGKNQKTVKAGWKTVETDLQILRDMASMPIKKVHDKYYPKMNPELAARRFDNRLQKIKNRIVKYRTYINTVEAIRRQSRYVKKRLIIPEEREEEDWFAGYGEPVD